MTVPPIRSTTHGYLPIQLGYATAGSSIRGAKDRPLTQGSSPGYSIRGTKASLATTLATTPFPGKRAQFAFQSNGWSLSHRNLIRNWHFVSQTEGSLFQEFWVYGYGNGTAALAIQAREEHCQAATKYWTACGVVPSLPRQGQTLCIGTGDSLQLLFTTLFLHNEFPANHRPFLQTIATTGYWRPPILIETKL